MDTLDWTHKNVEITDIRKLSEFYIFTINQKDIQGPLLVKGSIFEERLKSYFLKESWRISREEIIGVKWNMYISKGRYIKIQSLGNIQTFEMDPQKYYVSYLEIDGLLGTFQSVYKEKEHKENKEKI